MLCDSALFHNLNLKLVEHNLKLIKLLLIKNKDTFRLCTMTKNCCHKTESLLFYVEHKISKCFILLNIFFFHNAESFCFRAELDLQRITTDLVPSLYNICFPL